jgi:hypothetical protein
MLADASPLLSSTDSSLLIIYKFEKGNRSASILADYELINWDSIPLRGRDSFCATTTKPGLMSNECPG